MNISFALTTEQVRRRIKTETRRLGWDQILAEALAIPLPRYRPVITDLTCGNGQLVTGSAGPSTHHLLGCDIEAAAERGTNPLTFSAALEDKRVVADLTRFYPLLCAVKWQADLFVLNPPWDLHWYRKPLISLADSDCPAVRSAFQQHDGRTSRDTIDSTVATLCMALDRSSAFGEGVLIANNATLQRLIFDPDAPHHALASHVWARFAIEGNICAPAKPGAHSDFKTGVIYFARGHTHGWRACGALASTPEGVRNEMERLQDSRIVKRKGAEITPSKGFHTETSPELWLAAREEWERVNAGKPKSEWNIYLDRDGTLKTDLSVFDTASGRVDKQAADRLHNLNGKHPMQLILQVQQRKELVKATAPGSPWRVAPAVTEAVNAALLDYDNIRSPLTALNPIQRLGYLDELDSIACEKDLGDSFTVGRQYPIRTETLQVKRSGTKMNLSGELDDVEWEGSELAIFIRDDGGVERLFMEGRLRDDPNVKLSVQNDDQTAADKIDFTLHQIIRHFKIPEVPDVAAVRPDEYLHNLELLDEIERIVNA